MSQTQVVRHIVSAANAGNTKLAKLHLQRAAEAAPEDAAVWMWMAWFADSPLSAIHCLEMAREDERYRAVAEAGLTWCKALANFKTIGIAAQQAPAPVEPVADLPIEMVVEAEPVIEETIASHVAEVAQDVATTVSAEPTLEVDAPLADVEDETDTISEAYWEEVANDAWSTSARTETPPEWPTEEFPVANTADWDAGTPVAEAVVPPPLPVEPEVPAPSDTSDANTSWFGTWRSMPVIETEDVDSALAQAVQPEAYVPPAANWTAPQPVRAPMPFLQAELISEFKALQADAVIEETPTEDVVAPVNEVEATDVVEQAESVIESLDQVDHSLEPVTAEVPTEEAQPVWRAAKSEWFQQEPRAELNSVSAIETAAETIEPLIPAAVVPALPVAQPLFPSQPVQRLDDLWRTPLTESAPSEEPVAQVAPATVVAPPIPTEPHVAPVSVTPAAINDHPQEVERASASSGQTILVVDDSPTVRKLVAMTLEKRGYKVVSAFDGVAAIKEIATHSPTLILMDVNMPRLDGYQLCKLVKKHESTRHIPVLMLSGKDGMFDRLRGRLVGCSGYITKPFVPEELVEVVEHHLTAATEV